VQSFDATWWRFITPSIGSSLLHIRTFETQNILSLITNNELLMSGSKDTNHEITDMNPESLSSYSSKLIRHIVTVYVHIGPGYSVPHIHRFIADCSLHMALLCANKQRGRFYSNNLDFHFTIIISIILHIHCHYLYNTSFRASVRMDWIWSRCQRIMVSPFLGNNLYWLRFILIFVSIFKLKSMWYTKLHRFRFVRRSFQYVIRLSFYNFTLHIPSC
jgi:hypothetical protein